jgi:hypothetical protein
MDLNIVQTEVTALNRLFTYLITGTAFYFTLKIHRHWKILPDVTILIALQNSAWLINVQATRFHFEICFHNFNKCNKRKRDYGRSVIKYATEWDFALHEDEIQRQFNSQLNLINNDNFNYGTPLSLQPFDIHLLLQYKFICGYVLGAGMRCEVRHLYFILRHMVASHVNHKLLCKFWKIQV